MVTHNLAAMNTQRQFGINTKHKSKSSEKLSSGYKINRAADDAARLSISEKMRSQIRGLSQGVENTQDGVSLCQVADGALSEVSSMLHRMTELSIQSANGINSNEDRKAIQREMNEILSEINRIGETTKFNEQPIFKGTDKILRNPDGSLASFGSVEFDEFTLTDVNLGKTPLKAGENGDAIHLQAIIDKPNSVLDGKKFNLIYGSGSTSNSSLRITDTSGKQTIVRMEELTPTNFSSNATNTKWSRDFTYTSDTGTNITITQSIEIDEAADEKNYIISYDFQNAVNISNVEFMFNVDTAYNNNDSCEGYFINGNRVDEFCVYSEPGSNLTGNTTSQYVYNNIPDSLSIIDVDHALAFSEKISFGNNTKPDSLSIGLYHSIDDWNYYNSLDHRLGINADRKDLGFSLYYDLGDLSQSDSVKFNYGIVKTAADNNLNGITLKEDNRVVIEHSEKITLWIQSGAETGNGMPLVIGEMNSSVLGIENLDVSTVQGAEQAIDAVDLALQNLNSNRSKIGAQQNRLEHTIANSENIVENTTAAESRIRDTNMAEEMVEFSKHNILEQVSQSMLAQAKSMNDGVLQLLQ